MKPKKQNILHKIKTIWCITLIVTTSLTILFLTNTTRAVFTNIAKNAPITGQSIGDDLWEVNDGDRNTYAYTGIAYTDSKATVSLNIPEGCNTSYLYWKIQLWVMPGTGPNPAHLDIYGDSGWQTIRYYSNVYLGQTIAETVQYQGHISAARIWASKGTHWLFQNRWNFYELEVWANIPLLIANFSWSPQYPQPTDIITFDASSSYDPDANIVLYDWDWNNDGYYENATSSPTITHSWSDIGPHQVTLKVTDNNGTTNTITKTITVGYLSTGFFYYWTYPSSDYLERQIGNSYTIALHVINISSNSPVFNYGLEYTPKCKNSKGDPIDNPDFLNENSKCNVVISPTSETFAYVFGDEEQKSISQDEGYTFDFKIVPHWQWIKSRSLGDILTMLASDVGANIMGYCNINLGGADYFGAISDIDNFDHGLPCSIKYYYQGMGDPSPNSDGTITVYVPPIKVAYLRASLIAASAASGLTVIGLCYLPTIFFSWMAAGFFAAEAASYAASVIAYNAAVDPDNNYTIIAQPQLITIPALAEIPPGPAKNITETAFQYLSYTQAWNTSICRYFGALDNSSMEWALIQLSNAKYYAQKQHELAQSLHDQLENISSTFPEMNQEKIDEIKQNLSENGLPEFEQQVLSQMGFNATQIDSIKNYYENLNDSEYLNYIDLLNTSKLLINTTNATLNNEIPEMANCSLNANCSIDPNSIETSNPPNNVSLYVEFQNITNLTNYHIDSATLNNCIKPISIASTPGDYNHNGVNDFKIIFNTSDILNLSNEGEVMLSLFGNVTTPSGNISYFSGSSGVLIYGLPPNIPCAPFGPSQGIINETYTYSTSTNDPENSLVYYLYKWGDNSTSGWMGPCSSGSVINVSHAWNRTGTYQITVKVRDYYGQETNWSTPLNITMTDVPPQITNIQAIPSIQIGGGYVNISAIVTDNMQVNKVHLIIQNPNNTIENISITQNKTENTYYCNRTYGQGLEYSYCIWTNDTNGNANSSTMYTFLINNPPNVPSNPIPANSTTNVPVTDVALNWTGGDPDIDDIATYDIYFGTINPPSKIVSNQTNNTIDVGTLDYSTTYYWKIVSWDTQGASIAGPVWQFTTTSDSTTPITTISVEGTLGNNGWYVSPVIVSLNATDSQSGVNYTMYELDNSNWTMYTGPFEIDNDGTHMISYYSVDEAGNVETTKSANLNIDSTAPITTHAFSGTMGNNNWYTSNVTFTLTATDPSPPKKTGPTLTLDASKGSSGINHTYYKIDDGNWVEYIAPVIVSIDGPHNLSYYSVDLAGNTEPVKGPFSFKIDQTGSTISLTATAQNLLKTEWLLVANVSDATSGVFKVVFYVDNILLGNVTAPGPYEWNYEGSGKIAKAIVYDNAGNSKISNEVAVTVNEFSSQSMSTPLTQSQIITGMQISQQQMNIILSKQGLL
jgi:hypothetical protein